MGNIIKYELSFDAIECPDVGTTRQSLPKVRLVLWLVLFAILHASIFHKTFGYSDLTQPVICCACWFFLATYNLCFLDG